MSKDVETNEISKFTFFELFNIIRLIKISYKK